MRVDATVEKYLTVFGGPVLGIVVDEANQTIGDIDEGS